MNNMFVNDSEIDLQGSSTLAVWFITENLIDFEC